MKTKVVIEQFVIPHYRVPVFKELAKEVDLTLVTSTNKNVDGLHQVGGELPFKIVYLDERPESGLFHPEIFDLIEENKADVLISLSSSLDLMLSNKSAIKKIKSLRLKTIWMGCDGYAVRHFLPNLFINLLNPKRTLRTIKEIVAKSKIDHFLPYSSHTSKYLQQRLFVPKNKITIAHNAIDTSILRQRFTQWQDSGSKRDLYKIIFTGRLTPRKNVDTLIKAFGNIRKIYPQATLEIVGEGSDTENLKHLAKNLGLEGRVIFTGAIYDDNILANHLLSSSLFIMPSVGGLGFNSAMACALPIIYTHADGTEEDMFTEGINGWFFDGSVGDLTLKITSALKDPSKLLEMGLVSQKLVTEKFTVENMVRVYKETIEKVLKI